MAGEKKEIRYSTLCKASRIGTFDEVLHDVSSFHNKNNLVPRVRSLSLTKRIAASGNEIATKNQNKPLRLCRTDWKSTLSQLICFGCMIVTNC